MIFTSHLTFFAWPFQGGWNGLGVCHTWGRREIFTKFWWGNL